MTASTLRRPARTARDAVLSDLRSVHPNGITTTDLIGRHGPAVKTRIGELRADGWQIDTTEEDGVAYYTLVSLVRGAPTRVLAGCTIREDSRGGWAARTHQEAQGGPYDAALLARAEAAALAAYRAVLAAARTGAPVVEEPVVEEPVVEEPVVEELDLDDGFGWQPPPLPPEAEGWDGGGWGDYDEDDEDEGDEEEEEE